MPNATRKICNFPGCTAGEPDADENPTPYITPPYLQRRDKVSDDLKQHVFMAHELPLRHADAANNKLMAEATKIREETAKINAEAAARAPPQPQQQQPASAPQQVPPQQPKQKGDRIPRPVVDENINESDWGFFKSQWHMYVIGTGLTGDAVILHLWQACTEALQHTLHHSGAGSITDPSELLKTIKQLAVKKLNNLVNIIELQKLGQYRDETISAYSARLNGQASLCDFNVECPSCNTDNSFKDKSIMYQMICGLHDRDQMERVLQAAAQVEGGELSLTRVIKLLEALEMGKASQKLVDSNGSSLNRLSQHRKNKDNSRQNAKESREKPRNNKDKPNGCANCGSKQHSSKLSDRRQHCDAFQEECAGCGVMGHYKNLCRGGGKAACSKSRDNKTPDKTNAKVAAVSEDTTTTTTAPEEQDTASLGQISADWFLISASPSPTRNSRFNFDKVNMEEPWRASTPVNKDTKLNTINSSSKLPHMVCDKSASTRVIALADTGAQM